jgi:hypothetical protein
MHHEMLTQCNLFHKRGHVESAFHEACSAVGTGTPRWSLLQPPVHLGSAVIYRFGFVILHFTLIFFDLTVGCSTKKGCIRMGGYPHLFSHLQQCIISNLSDVIIIINQCRLAI